MKTCPNCGKEFDDSVRFCTACGFNFEPEGAGMNNDAPPNADPTSFVNYAADPYDHTVQFDPRDVSDNKVLAMLPYLSGWIGIVVALLAINHSDYVAFHLKQALKIQVTSILLAIVAVLLCWTVIVPIAAGICCLIVFVLKIIMFVNVCKGKAKEVPIICKFGFLR